MKNKFDILLEKLEVAKDNVLADLHDDCNYDKKNNIKITIGDTAVDIELNADVYTGLQQFLEDQSKMEDELKEGVCVDE